MRWVCPRCPAMHPWTMPDCSARGWQLRPSGWARMSRSARTPAQKNMHNSHRRVGRLRALGDADPIEKRGGEVEALQTQEPESSAGQEEKEKEEQTESKVKDACIHATPHNGALESTDITTRA